MGPTGTGKTRGVMESTAMTRSVVSPTTTIPLSGITVRTFFCLTNSAPSFVSPICSTTWTAIPSCFPVGMLTVQLVTPLFTLFPTSVLNSSTETFRLTSPIPGAFYRRIYHIIEYSAEGCNSEPVPVQETLPSCFTELSDTDEQFPF